MSLIFKFLQPRSIFKGESFLGLENENINLLEEQTCKGENVHTCMETLTSARGTLATGVDCDQSSLTITVIKALTRLSKLTVSKILERCNYSGSTVI